MIYKDKYSPEFGQKVISFCENLGMTPDYFIVCSYFESGGTFSPTIKNKYSNAVGIIQYMPQTCAFLLGVPASEIRKMTSAQLSVYTHIFEQMTAIEQLDYAEKYFRPYKNKLKTLEDTYMAILLPTAIGKPNDAVIFDKNDPKYLKRYLQNKGLDYNKDGIVTKEEAARRVKELYVAGLKKEIDLQKYFADVEARGLENIV